MIIRTLAVNYFQTVTDWPGFLACQSQSLSISLFFQPIFAFEKLILNGWPLAILAIILWSGTFSVWHSLMLFFFAYYSKVASIRYLQSVTTTMWAFLECIWSKAFINSENVSLSKIKGTPLFTVACHLRSMR